MSRGLQNRKGSTSAELLSSEEGELLLPAGAGAQPAAAEEELVRERSYTLAVQKWLAGCAFRTRWVRPAAANSPFTHPPPPPCLVALQKSGSLKGEWGNVLLLVLLYAIQGVPLGLSMGSMCVGTGAAWVLGRGGVCSHWCAEL